MLGTRLAVAMNVIEVTIMSEREKHFSFEKFLAFLKRGVRVLDGHELMGWLGDLMFFIQQFRADGDLRREQEAIILYNVVKEELNRRGCFVEEFGDFSVK